MPKQDPLVVIIHGTVGYPEENWFPWLQKELTNASIQTVIPTFPTPEGQSLEAWTTAFHNQVGKLQAEMILVGHSMGVGFILNLLESVQKPIQAAFLASGFIGLLDIEKFDRLNASFFMNDFNWSAIRNNAKLIHLYHGENDPYVPLDKAQQLESALDAELTIVPNGGHLNSAAGFDSFPQLRDDLLAVVARANP